jgi:hypothetical protein
MWYRISAEPEYLKAELFNRRSAEETREFLQALAAEGMKHGLRRALITVSASDPIFSVERWGFSTFVQLAEKISDRIALMADTRELRFSQEYTAMLARWRGVNVRTFPDEQTARAWLTDRRRQADRRQAQERIEHAERRSAQARRGQRLTQGVTG